MRQLVVTGMHTLLPAIETTDVISNTEDKQIKRDMGRYFQHIFMLFPLSFGYIFYDTCVVIIIRESCIKYGRHNSNTDISTFFFINVEICICRRIFYFKTQIYASPLLLCIKY